MLIILYMMYFNHQSVTDQNVIENSLNRTERRINDLRFHYTMIIDFKTRRIENELQRKIL